MPTGRMPPSTISRRIFPRRDAFRNHSLTFPISITPDILYSSLRALRYSSGVMPVPSRNTLEK